MVIHIQPVYGIRLYDRIFFVVVQNSDLLEIGISFVDVVDAFQGTRLADGMFLCGLGFNQIIAYTQHTVIQIIFRLGLVIDRRLSELLRGVALLIVNLQQDAVLPAVAALRHILFGHDKELFLHNGGIGDL